MAVGEAFERLALHIGPSNSSISVPLTGSSDTREAHIAWSKFGCCDHHSQEDENGLSSVYVYATHLASNESNLVPLEAVNFGHILRSRIPTSTGAAVHSSYQLAVRAGVLEALERDAFMGMWYSRKVFPTIVPDADSLLYEYLIAARGDAPELHLIDLSSIHRIPCVVAITFGEAGRYGIGAAAKSSLHAAAVSAANEAMSVYNHAFFEPTVRVIHDANEIASFEDHVAWYQDNSSRVESLRWMASGEQIQYSNDTLLETWHEPNFDNALIETLHISGIDTFVVPLASSQSRSFGLEAVKVVATGALDLTVGVSGQCVNHRRFSSQSFRRVFGCPTINLDPHPFP